MTSREIIFFIAFYRDPIIVSRYMERALLSIPFQSPDGTISFETASDQPISISLPFSEERLLDLFLLAIYGR